MQMRSELNPYRSTCGALLNAHTRRDAVEDRGVILADGIQRGAQLEAGRIITVPPARTDAIMTQVMA